MLTSKCSRGLHSLYKRHINVSFKQTRSAYIVLLPEVDTELAEKLLSVHEDLPAFSKLSTDKIGTMMGKQIVDYECSVRNMDRKLEETPHLYPDLFEDILDPLEKVTSSFDTIWGLLKTLYLGNSNLVPATTYFSLATRGVHARGVRFQAESLYRACKSCDKSKVTEEQARLVEKHVVEGDLSLLDAKPRFRTIGQLKTQKLIDRQYHFRIRVEAARAQFFLTIDDSMIVRDFPKSVLKLMSTAGNDSIEGPWTVKLNFNIGDKFMEYCPDRDLRWLVWNAEDKAASLVEENRELANSVCLEEIRFMRHELAVVAGYKNHFEANLKTKMAGSIENIRNTLDSFLAVAKPAQMEEILALQDFANANNFEYPLQLWDLPYWSRKFKYSIFNFDDEKLRNYLPADKVVDGLFNLCSRLFGIKIQQQKETDVWHPDVKFYYIYEADGDKPVAGFYFDLYSRDNKMRVLEGDVQLISIRNASRVTRRVLPLTAFLMNLPPPSDEKPSLMSFSEVCAMFGKFGHNLQYLLCKSSYADVAGLNFVEYDAVGICSEFMKNWVYDPETFDSIHGHYDTGDKITDKVDLQGVKNHLAGYKMCKEIYKAKLDIRMHTETQKFWNDMLPEMWDDHFIFPMSKYHSDPVRYVDIFSGPWGAAYYSHLWSQMVAADAYQAFLDEKTDESNLGIRFRDTFFAFGGSCHAGEVFRRFRGRDPQPKILLNQLGLTNTNLDSKSKESVEDPNVAYTC
ncbi:uncharacterized protein LOC135839798 [Planococcus citri]|uniref:uncharacterized protein LOC135839798 n=1 Tax=Planococcus citri TaxID=170843 RepID=UPI0031F8502A